jgi:type I restriction enzyme S subunit
MGKKLSNKDNLSIYWTEEKVENAFENISLTGIKIKQKDYLKTGEYPVIDQGQEIIGGYHNNKDFIVPGDPPFIVFGDHTKVKKYINFKFIAGADGVKVLKPSAFFIPKLFYYFLHCISLPDKGYARHFQFLKKSEIPLPPLPEQRAIVAKIEQLFSELDSGVENLKKAQAQLKVYRQAVLKWAFEGKLTEEWRKKQKDLPTAETLLAQIKTEREKQAEKNNKKLKPIPPISKEELAELPKLPKGWDWIKLGEILWHLADGPHYSPKYLDNGIPFISGGNVRPDGVDFKNTKFISRELNEELSKRCKPEFGDILYTKGGTTGIARVNTYSFDFNVWVHVAVLKIVKSILPFYIQHVLNSNHCYKQSQIYTHGVGNQDLGLTRMVLITIPICSVAEQQQIVQEIEERLSVCDKLEETIAQSLQKAESLRQSILKKAFAGKLLTKTELDEVRKAPDWEPVEKLLQRIKKEKENEKG